ncbi:MAG TPA: hypothetical protein VKY90_07275 [Candidatus Dormibacteraeota bacterium]|nr:hypothetical protein [Candidatus Dormibacteraeota bacterium]
MVDVRARPAGPGWECTVEVEEGTTRSRHTVRVEPGDLRRWGRPGETAEQLVRRAFEFLLAREPVGQILRSFAVADIERYFPEFDQEIRRL